MKNFSKLATPSTVIASAAYQNAFIQDSLSEADILTLQEKFLTNGFQYIKVKRLSSGRSLVYRFLHSLGIYHDIAVVTTQDIPLEKNITHVYHELIMGGYLNPFEERYLEEFFIEEFYFDFMWIEATKQLITTSWYTHFEAKLIDYKLDQHIPMIVILADD